MTFLYFSKVVKLSTQIIYLLRIIPELFCAATEKANVCFDFSLYGGKQLNRMQKRKGPSVKEGRKDSEFVELISGTG
ncbi:hypothetical protein APB76_00310 [Vibrio bivalvicida]|uniref:Uncharacterized protein n=1 Tax=Vibrio bivalvicida TaxID=1276888 RepID=A0A177Y6Y2_9VIBR|nr:hypothetical protein APB76_00310 [Vibrio bivalvicida]